MPGLTGQSSTPWSPGQAGRHQSPSLRTNPLRHNKLAIADLLTPTDSAICAAVSPRSNRAPSHSTWSAGHRRRGAAEERFGGWRLVMPGYISRFSQSYVIVGKYVRKILKS